MNKYIDADRLRAEIIRLRKDKPFHNDSSFFAYLHGLSRIEDFIDSLQQEQLEESIAKEAIQLVFEEKLTPFKDGNQWCFLLGHNIQEGVCGFGDTILDAAIAFYKDYSTTKIHIGELKKTMEQPEVDLASEIEKYYYDNFAFISSAHTPTKDIVSDIATHFYELEQRKEKEESK